MLLTILYKTVAFLEKVICLPLTLPWARASEETAVHIKASMAASDDISACWHCSAVPIKTFQAPKRYSVRTWDKICTAREWNQQNSDRRVKERFKRFTVWRTSVKYPQPFSSWKIPLLHQPGKKFHFLFCSQEEAVTWQWSIANNKHQQSLASFHSGYTSWSPSFPLYFGRLCRLQGLSATMMTTYVSSVKWNQKLHVRIDTDFWPSWKLWLPKWQPSLKKWKKYKLFS